MPTATAAATLIREAEEADFPAVVSVLRAANAQFERVLPPAFYHAYLTNVLDIRSRLHESLLLVAEHEGRIAGTIALYPDASREGWGWPAHWSGIRAVAVEPSARGHGIGHDLALECMDRSRSLGAEAVCLHTATFMEAAVAMYERLGFRRVREFDREAGSLFTSDARVSPIAALAYRCDL